MFGKKDKNNVLHHSKLQPSKYVVAMLKGPSWSLGSYNKQKLQKITGKA